MRMTSMDRPVKKQYGQTYQQTNRQTYRQTEWTNLSIDNMNYVQTCNKPTEFINKAHIAK